MVFSIDGASGPAYGTLRIRYVRGFLGIFQSGWLVNSD
jgi:hypothetical protein